MNSTELVKVYFSSLLLKISHCFEMKQIFKEGVKVDYDLSFSGTEGIFCCFGVFYWFFYWFIKF